MEVERDWLVQGDVCDFEVFADFGVESFQLEGAVVDLGLDLSPFWTRRCRWREEKHGAVDCVGLVESFCETCACFG